MSTAELIPNFRQIEGVFVISAGAATPLFECAEEHDAEMAVMSLNELLERADASDAREKALRGALEEIIGWKDRAGDDRQEVNEMVAIAEAALRAPIAHPVSEDKGEEQHCPNCYGGHQAPCQWCGDSGRVTFVPGKGKVQP